MKVLWKSSISGKTYEDECELRKGETVSKLEKRIRKEFDAFNEEENRVYKDKALNKIFVRLVSDEDKLLR